MTCKLLNPLMAFAFALLSATGLALAQESLPNPGRDAQNSLPKPNATQLNFEATGPQAGEQVPDLRLYTLNGEVQRLSDAWRGGPTLLITSSLTCPKSRSRWPEIKELVEKYQDRINVVIVYVIEAHPVGSICPYKGVEDITVENERDGILRRQPKTLEDRLELAQDFKRLLRISTPIYIDNMQDEAWKALGAAPNLSLLVDQQGIVVARSGWFTGSNSQAAIEKYLQASRENSVKPLPREQVREQARPIFAQLENAGFKSYGVAWTVRREGGGGLVRMIKAVPAVVNLVIESHQGHPYDATLLMDAVLEGNADAVKLLLANGADVGARTESYASALQIAAERGDVAIARLLLDKGADPRFPRTGRSPLHEAALHGHTTFVRLLLDIGLRHDFYSAIALGEAELVRQELQTDPSRALRPDGAQRMPLDYAAANGQLEIAKLLLAHGAPVVRDRYVPLPPPLHRAIARNDAAMVELLLRAGSSPDTALGYGGEFANAKPAIHLAVDQKNLTIVRLLLASKADLKVRDTYSRTALDRAAEAGQSEIAAALIQAGADINSRQLGFALPCGSGEERVPSNTTPLHYAASSGNLAALKVLLAAGAKVNAVTKTGETPLMYALVSKTENPTANDRLNIIELLIASGADVNACDGHGRSVLDLATNRRDDNPRSQESHQELAVLLQRHGAKSGAPVAKKPAQAGPIER